MNFKLEKRKSVTYKRLKKKKRLQIAYIINEVRCAKMLQASR